MVNLGNYSKLLTSSHNSYLLHIHVTAIKCTKSESNCQNHTWLCESWQMAVLSRAQWASTLNISRLFEGSSHFNRWLIGWGNQINCDDQIRNLNRFPLQPRDVFHNMEPMMYTVNCSISIYISDKLDSVFRCEYGPHRLMDSKYQARRFIKVQVLFTVGRPIAVDVE